MYVERHRGYAYVIKGTYAFIYSYVTCSAGDCTYAHAQYFRTYIVRGTRWYQPEIPVPA